MKPRIFIAMHYMEIGGAESSLIGLLEALDPERMDIDLFVYSHQGVFMNAIPGYVNLLPEIQSYSVIEKPMKEALQKGQVMVVLARLLARKQTQKYYKHVRDDRPHAANWGYLGKNLAVVLPSLHKYGEYNLAISYLNPHDIVLRNVKAKKYLAWIHTDYQQISLNTELELPVWDGYDKIVSISPDVTKSFVEVFPSLAGKILECENMIPKRLISRYADEPLAYKNFKQEGVVTLCSIGRIGYAKNYDNVPYMARKLKDLSLELRERRTNESSFKHYNLSLIDSLDKEFKFHWYIVGPGDHSDIDTLAKKLGVDDVVTFLGPSDNPYPYIKNCDIYVHPSRYEGKSIVVREAQMLCKPVIITNYSTARSQINDGMDGIICELDNEKIAEAIYELAVDKEKQELLIAYLKAHDNTGTNEVEKIYKLLK